MTKYKAIILPEKVFIADSLNKDWCAVALDKDFLFDGRNALPTLKKGWYELPNLPKKVEKLIAPPKIISFYKLKEGFVATEKLPERLPEYFFNWDGDEEEYNNAEIKGLYDPVYEQKEPYFENVEFEIETIAHKGSSWKFLAAPKNVQHLLVDEIIKLPELLQDEHCFLSSEESYCRIRDFVKLNINPRVAYVSSDYNFHFVVSKKIPLHEKEKYRKCLNIFAKRPKYVDDYRVNRSIEVYNLTPNEKNNREYQNSQLAPKFEGANYEDLENNINNYLAELIEKINEPVQDCPHCKGRGVVAP